MFGIFTDPEKIASKVFDEAINPTISGIKSLYEIETKNRFLPEELWEKMYFIGFFYGLCVSVISASQKRAATAKDSRIALLIFFNYVVPRNLKHLVDGIIRDCGANDELARGLNNAAAIVGLIYGTVKPELLMNEPHFIKANQVAKEFIGKEDQFDDILTSPGYKEIMYKELIKILFIDEVKKL